MKAIVYGFARSGRAVAERLRESRDDVVLVDRSLGNEDDLAALDGVGLVVKSPGVPGEAPSSSPRASVGSPCGRRSNSATACSTARSSSA